ADVPPAGAGGWRGGGFQPAMTPQIQWLRSGTRSGRRLPTKVPGCGRGCGPDPRGLAEGWPSIVPAARRSALVPMGADKGVDGVDHVVEHGSGKSGVGAKENGAIHQFVRPRQISHDAHRTGPVLAQLDEGRLPDEI